MPTEISRRSLLKRSGGVLSAFAWAGLPSVLAQAYFSRSRIRGEIVGASSSVGHRLRSGEFPPVTRKESYNVVIVGGGVSGLSALRALKKGGVASVRLLELEPTVGGNSKSGKNAVGSYPWGAHYLPLPSLENRDLIRFLDESGAIVGLTPDHLPIYREEFLSFEMQERIYYDHQWHEGLVPWTRLKGDESDEFRRFFRRMAEFRELKGSDGRRGFTIPLELSSADESIRKLDAISMAAFLSGEAFHGKELKRYVDYCCRDDYGAPSDLVSAWAGIHYFASRTGRAGNLGSDQVLTWPEGNGWLVERLRQPVESSIQTQALVTHVENESDGVLVRYWDQRAQASVEVRAQAVVYAAPRFTAKYSVPELKQDFSKLTYSPWMVANLTLKRPLRPRQGVSMAWDNVLLEGIGLGYVNSKHQLIERYPGRSVLTYYLPLDQESPGQARQAALETDHARWAAQVLKDLEHAHPDLPDALERADVCVWGHGMIRPTPGYLWGQARQEFLKPLGRIWFAHSDMSGISIFEEAFYRGNEAARSVLSLGVGHAS